jgi:hypothetical protein
MQIVLMCLLKHVRYLSIERLKSDKLNSTNYWIKRMCDNEKLDHWTL